MGSTPPGAANALAVSSQPPAPGSALRVLNGPPDQARLPGAMRSGHLVLQVPGVLFRQDPRDVGIHHDPPRRGPLLPAPSSFAVRPGAPHRAEALSPGQREV